MYEGEKEGVTAPGGVVTTQPGVPGPKLPGDNWMPIPHGVIPNCPPGLEYLTMIDQFVVHQQLELLEVITGFECKNRYKISNTLGQQIYYAKEQSGWFARQFCGPYRSFDIRVLDNNQQEVIHIRRPPDCDACCSRCGFQKVEVYSPPGQLVGSIKDVGGWCGSWCHEKYAIMDAYDNVVLRMKWPVIRCKGSCCGDIKYKVYSEDMTAKVGEVIKNWSGIAKEVFTTSDNFSVSFPMDLDVKMKAVMIGACFLIDFLYYQFNK